MNVLTATILRQPLKSWNWTILNRISSSHHLPTAVVEALHPIGWSTFRSLPAAVVGTWATARIATTLAAGTLESLKTLVLEHVKGIWQMFEIIFQCLFTFLDLAKMNVFNCYIIKMGTLRDICISCPNYVSLFPFSETTGPFPKAPRTDGLDLSRLNLDMARFNPKADDLESGSEA